MRIELWKPPYDADPNRPDLTAAPASVAYQQVFDVRCPQANQIAAVVVIRCGSTTHAFDFDQRYVGLEFTHAGDDRLEVVGPPRGEIAPPGYYTLWILNGAGLPCKYARFIRIGRQGS
jgi:hypothetical protein